METLHQSRTCIICGGKKNGGADICRDCYLNQARERQAQLLRARERRALKPLLVRRAAPPPASESVTAPSAVAPDRFQETFQRLNAELRIKRG